MIHSIEKIRSGLLAERIFCVCLGLLGKRIADENALPSPVVMTLSPAAFLPESITG